MTAQALKAWQVSFAVEGTQDLRKADVIVSWDLADWEQRAKGQMTRLEMQMGDRHNIRTVIVVNMASVRGQPSTQQLHTISHQLGHAFGLWGHSDNPNDLMFPAFRQEANDYPARWSWRSVGMMSRVQPPGKAQGFQPSMRDINTLLKVYDQPATDLSSYNIY